MKIRRLILAVLSVCALQALALDVVNTAGTLHERVTDLNVTSLTVSGTMDARDFYFMADKLPQLSTVDLRAVEVIACETAQQYYGQHLFDKDELPTCALADTRVTSLTLPAGLKVIAKAALAGCDQLTTLVLPQALDSISDYAFAGCSALKAVTLPASVRTVGTGAFMRCTSLESFGVSPSSQLQRLDATALMDCPALTTLSLGTSLQNMGERVLAGSGVKTVNLTDSKQLKEVGDWAMVRTPVTQARFPVGLTALGDGAFLYDKDLTSVYLGNLEHLNDYALAGTGLKGTWAPAAISTIGDYALYNVSTLSIVELPSTVTWLGDYAMAGMTGMQSITSNAVDVPALGDNVWAGVNQPAVDLYVPAASTDLYRVAMQWRHFNFETVKWLKGDVNNDGEVSLADINVLIDIILGASADAETMYRADVNEDDEVSLADINALINIILSPLSLMGMPLHIDNSVAVTPHVIAAAQAKLQEMEQQRVATATANTDD